MGWQEASGYNRWALAEAVISRFKRVIGDGLRSRTDQRQATEVAITVTVLNRMLKQIAAAFLTFDRSDASECRKTWQKRVLLSPASRLHHLRLDPRKTFFRKAKAPSVLKSDDASRGVWVQGTTEFAFSAERAKSA